MGVDILRFLPAAVIVSIVLTVFVSEILKRLDQKKLFKGYRIVLPLILSFGFSWLMKIGSFFQSPDQVWFYWAVIFMASVVFYELILKKAEEKWGISLKK